MSGGSHTTLIRLEGKSSKSIKVLRVFFAKLIDVLRVNPKLLFYGGVSLINGIAQYKILTEAVGGFYTSPVLAT